jgi:DNA helicase-2/ATP-dependent DNA helicase PcrA
LKAGKDRALLTTFHSFAAEILRQHGHHIGLRPDFTILVEQADREAVATEAMKRLGEDVADMSFPRFCGQSFRPPSRTLYGLYESVLRTQWG